MRFLLALPLLIGCATDPTTPADAPAPDALPACVELGCPGLTLVCRRNCTCSHDKADPGIPCQPYPSCGSLGCIALACDDHVCTCELADGSSTSCEN